MTSAMCDRFCMFLGIKHGAKGNKLIGRLQFQFCGKFRVMLIQDKQGHPCKCAECIIGGVFNGMTTRN